MGKVTLSVRQVLVFVALATFGYLAITYIYLEQIVPRTPLEWKTFDERTIDLIDRPKNPMLIAIIDSSLGKTPNRQYYFEYNSNDQPNEELRKFLRRNNVSLFSVDLEALFRVEDNLFDKIAIEKIGDSVKGQNSDPGEDGFVLPDFVLAIPGKDQLVPFKDIWLNPKSFMEKFSRVVDHR